MVFLRSEHSRQKRMRRAHTLAHAWRVLAKYFDAGRLRFPRSAQRQQIVNHFQNGEYQPTRIQQPSAQCADRTSRVVLFATRERAVALSSLYVVQPSPRARKHSQAFHSCTDKLCSQANTSTHLHSLDRSNPERFH